MDQTLQGLAADQELRRIDRGPVTDRAAEPDYCAVIRAVTRRDNAPVVIDGKTAANDLGFTTALEF